MIRLNRLAIHSVWAVWAITLTSTAAHAELIASRTTVLGPFTGHHAPLHPDNSRAAIEYYGTDLGWSYVHDGQLHFLFGDTWKNERGEPIDRTLDDAFGVIDLHKWPDGSRISSTAIPLLKLATRAGTSQLAPLDTSIPAEGLKTPVGGFSSGEREFAIFITGKPQACKVDADCSSGFTCETSVGFVGERPGKSAGLTLACEEGSTGCVADTLFDQDNKPISTRDSLATRPSSPVKDSGLCADKTSSIWTESPSGRTSATTMEHVVAVRDTKDPASYRIMARWHTTKFINVAMRTVDDFDPARGIGRQHQDYRNVATTRTPNRRVLLWGRPEFIGVNARNQSLSLYFAYADVPKEPELAWQLNYYSGSDAAGTPNYSRDEREARAVDLDSTQAGVQAREAHDIVQHMSVVWLEPLQQWVMFYGGGINTIPLPLIAPTCGLLEIFTRTECKNVVIGNGAIRMRTASDPWGPWSPPQDVFIGGDATRRPTEHQYAPGGVLHHPDCVGERCQSRSPSLPKGDYGWLYGANIIEPWTTVDADGVDVIWNASTWNPYRVVLLKTRIDRIKK
jgi:hypothetical protein